MTVVIGLAGLLFTGFGVFTSMALAAILVLLIAVVASFHRVGDACAVRPHGSTGAARGAPQEPGTQPLGVGRVRGRRSVPASTIRRILLPTAVVMLAALAVLLDLDPDRRAGSE